MNSASERPGGRLKALHSRVAKFACLWHATSSAERTALAGSQCIYMNDSGEQLRAILCSRKTFIFISMYVQAFLNY